MASAAALAVAHFVVLTLFSFCIYWQFGSNVSRIARMQYFIFPGSTRCVVTRPGTPGPCSPDLSHSWQGLRDMSRDRALWHTGAGVWCSKAAVQPHVSWKLSFAKSRHYIITSRHDPVHPAWTNSADYFAACTEFQSRYQRIGFKAGPAKFCLS